MALFLKNVLPMCILLNKYSPKDTKTTWLNIALPENLAPNKTVIITGIKKAPAKPKT